MKKSLIYFISLFVVLTTISTAKNSFVKLPNRVDGVHFIANLPNGQIYLNDDGISFVAIKLTPDSDGLSQSKNPNQYELHRVNFKFQNSKKPIVSTSDITSDSEYFIYNEKSVELFRINEIHYSNIYNGIDFKAYFTADDEFEFDFIVHPNANPADIQLLIEHQKSLKLNDSGKLNIEFEFDELVIDNPYSYQVEDDTNSEIISSFSLNNSILSFNMGEYDNTKKLIIDPITRFMGSYFGGNGSDVANDIAEDTQGNYYITGYTRSPLNIAHNGYQLVIGGIEDAYLAKFDVNDNRIWSTYFGGDNYESASSVALDNIGNIFIAGETRSDNNISTANAHQVSYGGGNSDGFIAKFTPSGLSEWATYYGGDNIDIINDLETDGSGNLLVVGTTESDNNIFFSGYQFGRNGLSDAFVIKFNSTGARQWGTYYGGSLNDVGNGITIDPNRNVYIIGTTNSADDINYLGTKPSLSGGTDAFVTSFEDDGNIRWSTYYGGNVNDIGQSISADGQYLYFGGNTQSINGIAFNGFQNDFSGNRDGYLVKFDFFQNPYWGTYFGGTGLDYINSIYSTGSSIYVAGNTNSTSKISIVGWQQSFGGGDFDGFLSKFMSDGTVKWSTYYGGTGTDVIEGVSNSKTLLIAGHTTSNNNINQNGFQTTYSGQQDAMYAEMSESELNLNLIQAQYCSEKDYSVNVMFSNLNFANDNEFVIELSDYLGNFANPTEIGRKQSNINTDVNIKIPVITDFSKNYRVRLKSTNPQYNGKTSLDSITIFPEPRIDNSSAPLCVGKDMIFSTYDLPEVTYSWIFENGIKTDSSQISNKVHWDNAGEYKVTLISENPICKDTATKTVKVYDNPVAEFNGDTTACELSNTIYMTINKPNIKHTWNIKGGELLTISEDGAEASIRWGKKSAAKVILIARDTITKCETTINRNITIIETPVANIMGADTTCKECTETLSTDDMGKSKWKIQSGTIVNESNTQLTFKPLATADSVIVTLIKSNTSGKCSDSTSKVVYITNSKKANITGTNQVCVLDEYVYSTSSDPILTNSWTITGGTEVSKTANTITVNWSPVGQASLKLVQKSNDNSYIDSTTLNVTVQAKPISFNHGIPSEVCMGDTVPIKFILMPQETIVIKINGTNIENESFYLAASSGVKEVDFEISNEFGCTLKGKYEMLAKDKPLSATISIDGTEINSDKNGIHRWYRNNEIIVDEKTSKLTVSDDGIYTCTYLLNGCWSEESNRINYSTSSIEDFTRLGINIYPNPADNILQLSTDIIIDKFELVDILGNRIISTSNVFSTEYDISELNAGIYFVKITVNDKLLTKKIIVK